MINAQETPALEFLELREYREVRILWSSWTLLWVSERKKKNQNTSHFYSIYWEMFITKMHNLQYTN